ncbi:MAG: Calx-beta domain-containing protein [Anaerolineaceae bacterium]
MNMKSFLKKISAITILSLIMALVPLSTANAAWSGQFTLSSATYSVGESGGTVSITITLSGSRTGGKPWNTTVNYATSDGTAIAGSDYTATSGSRFFKRKGSYTFTIPITSDLNPEIDETFTVTLSSPTNGATLGTPSSAVVTIQDDDMIGIIVTPTSGLSVTEAGGTASFTIILQKQPAYDVDIALTSSDTTEGTVYPSSLTFNITNWYLARTVTITGVDDFVDDGDIPFTIVTAPAVSSDPLYAGLDASDVSAVNVDNDTVGITVTPTSGLYVTETGGTDTFTVVLNTLPAYDVTLDLSSSDPTEGTVSPASLIFTPTDWSTPQTVTVTGVGDMVEEGNKDFYIVTAPASSTDSAYNGLDASDVTVTAIDNDTAGITVIPTTGLSVTEAGGTDTFTVLLNTLPAYDVTIDLSSSDTSEGTVSPESLTFTAANWSTPQTVTVTGVDDLADDGDIAYTIITAQASSGDSYYNVINASDVSVTTIDNDTAGITVAPTINLSVTEAGGTDTFTVVLNTLPAYDVIIGLSSSDTTEGTVSPASLTFTPDNWFTHQTVTITGVDDPDNDFNVDFTIITAPASSSDTAYSGVNASDVTVTNLDNDTADITIIPTGGLIVTEAGGIDTFIVVLNTRPTADVTITLSSSDLTEGTLSPGSLTFTDTNWDTPQTVTVTGVEDLVDDGDISFMITSVVGSTDPDYDAFDTNDVVFTNIDNDTAGITVNRTIGLSVTEAGGTDTFSIVFDAEPIVDIHILISSSDLTEGTVSPDMLMFTPANWSTPQTVTVTGVDDLVDDGDIAFTIITEHVACTDPAYNGLDVSDVAVTNMDDDAPNTPPVAMPDTYSTTWNHAISVEVLNGVLSNDIDAEGDPLTAVLVTGPVTEQGTLTLNTDGSFTFTPADDFSGDATFTYQADDGLELSTIVTVTIHVVAFKVFLPLLARP